MKKQMTIFLCMCVALCFSACAFGQTSESVDNASSVGISSSLEAGENSSEASSEIEEGAYRIYYDLSLANACVPNDIAISYDETKGMYYTEALFGEAYTLMQPKCDGYEFLAWKLANDTSKNFSDGVYALESDVYLIATWTGKVIDSPFA